VWDNTVSKVAKYIRGVKFIAECRGWLVVAVCGVCAGILREKLPDSVLSMKDARSHLVLHGGEGQGVMENLGKGIIGLGIILIVVGLFIWLAADKLSWFGNLPGDIHIERPGFRFYAPITTMLLLSVGLSLLLWLFGKFFR
jgi:H+/Cl- antiporter ClcA